MEHQKSQNLFQSFRFALSGISRTLVTQRNMKIHVLSALFILLIGLIFPFDAISRSIVLLCIALVLFSEIMNTAMEAIVDLYTGETHRLAQIAKDAAAGGVMLLAICSVFIFLGVLVHYYDAILATPSLTQKLAVIAAIVSLESVFLFTSLPAFLKFIVQGLALSLVIIMTVVSKEPIFGTAAFLIMALISFAPVVFKNDEK